MGKQLDAGGQQERQESRHISSLILAKLGFWFFFFFNNIAANQVCWEVTACCRAAGAWPSRLPASPLLGLIQPVRAAVGEGELAGVALLIGLRTVRSFNLFPWRSRIWNRMFACSCNIKNYGLLVNGFNSLHTWSCTCESG